MVTQFSQLEEEAIDYFVSFVQILGMPRSIGQIYGLMFVSTAPLAMDDIVERLEISKGSVSQGLTTLKGLGAISSLQVEGDRRDHYRAHLDVSKIVQHFFEENLEPRLDHSEQRLAKMLELSNNEDETHQRLEALKRWQDRGKEFLPLIKSFLKS